MAKTKSGVKFWPFPLYFGPFLERKWPFQRQHFPWVPRAHPYIFGISGTRRMGLASELIQNRTFVFFAPDTKIVASTASTLAEPSGLKVRNQTQSLASEARQNTFPSEARQIH